MENRKKKRADIPMLDTHPSVSQTSISERPASIETEFGRWRQKNRETDKKKKGYESTGRLCNLSLFGTVGALGATSNNASYPKYCQPMKNC